MTYKPTATLTAKFTFFSKLFLMIALTLLVFAGQVSNSPNASVVPLSACPGDFDGNGRVNIADFLAFSDAFGARSGEAKYNAVIDMDGSGAIDISDFLAFVEVFGTTCEKTPPAVLSDREVLVALYNATDGQNWVNSENWLSDRPLGEWYGVDTDASGRVVRLVLAGHFDSEVRADVPFGLSGALPPELGLLAELEELNLRINGLTGTIPPELENLTNLEELDLTLNSLRGVIPPELGNLTNLRYLHLEWNLLGDSIPPELGGLTNLRWLNLRENELTGPIPPELRGLARLEKLDLGRNNLTGLIPPWLGGLTELGVLKLRSNGLTGPIPSELGNLAKLRSLLLDRNSLSGPIPPELGNLNQLRWLWLYSNGLTGPIPLELGNLANLEMLTLNDNNLTGPIPSELGNLANLETLTLNDNNLTGQVPAVLGSLHKLHLINFSGNPLTGSLPLSFVGLNNLETFGCRSTVGVCVPATDEFREWIRQVDVRGNFAAAATDIPFCDEIDASVLEDLYEATNGSGWTRSEGWLKDENLSQWHGVQTDPIGRVSGLDLSSNGLSGHVPEALGLLANLKELRIRDNALAGRLPLSLAGVPLEVFDYPGTSLCFADDAGFRGWLNGIPRHSGTGVQCPPLTEREILEWLYRNAEGSNWHQSAGWLTDVPLAQWHGVETDDAGQVVELRLPYNSLTGSLPVELGQLSKLKVLDLAGNRFSGSIPSALGDLGGLVSLDLGSNQLSGSIPSELGKLSELRYLNLGQNQLSGSIPPALGDLGSLASLDLGPNQLSGEIPQELARLVNVTKLLLGRNFLSGPVPPELGDLIRLRELALEENQLSGDIPSSLGNLDAIESIRLADNELTGGIPPQLGALSHLSVLNLSGNELTGPIPAELGGISSLSVLQLFGNDLSGSIPTELGDLASLTILDLTDNRLSGSIPGRLGDLANLATLNLGDNELTGPLPAELGDATKLEGLDVGSNALTGPVPPEFGNFTLLNSLILADNPDLAGPLPPEITALGQIERFMAGGTGLCRPPDPRYATWFRTIADRRLVSCDGGAGVYLTQTIQSWDDPVPLLAGKPGLLRVFVTAPRGGTATMPAVRATFYMDGAERHSVHIPASAQTIPAEVMEGDLARSANAEIPDWVIVPGLEMVIEVDPEGALDPALGVTKRIPEEGRLAVDVQSVPPFRLTLIPFLNETEPDLTAVDDVSAMAADPNGHELLRDVRRLLPISELAVVAREPVIVSTPNVNLMLDQVQAMRLMEGGSGYWMGVWDGVQNAGRVSAAVGVASRGGKEAVARRNAFTIAHELGHNLSLKHAPCGSPTSTDPWFPHFGGSIGAWGYDFGENALVTPQAADVMSYCTHGTYWISDFFFNKALNHRLANEDATTAALAAEADPTRTLLLWGGVDAGGIPQLHPAFVVEAPPTLPSQGGPFRLAGRDKNGRILFSMNFRMQEIADGDGGSSFVFAIPTAPEWGGALASITLSGPGGLATLDESTDRPMAILRDQQTGQVRGFLSDLPSGEAAQVAAKSAVAAKPGVEVLFSRGIPDLR